MDKTISSASCKRYSAMPKVKNGSAALSFRYTRYAGATTIETPISAFSISTTPIASTISPRRYASSVENPRFFINTRSSFFFPKNSLRRLI